jgi:hypothetical protein
MPTRYEDFYTREYCLGYGVMVNITASQRPVSGFAVARGSIPRIRISFALVFFCQEWVFANERRTIFFRHRPAPDSISTKCRDFATHCAVIPFAARRKLKICGRKKSSHVRGSKLHVPTRSPYFSASKSVRRTHFCSPTHLIVKSHHFGVFAGQVICPITSACPKAM